MALYVKLCIQVLLYRRLSSQLCRNSSNYIAEIDELADHINEICWTIKSSYSHLDGPLTAIFTNAEIVSNLMKIIARIDSASLLDDDIISTCSQRLLNLPVSVENTSAPELERFSGTNLGNRVASLRKNDVYFLDMKESVAAFWPSILPSKSLASVLRINKVSLTTLEWISSTALRCKGKMEQFLTQKSIFIQFTIDGMTELYPILCVAREFDCIFNIKRCPGTPIRYRFVVSGEHNGTLAPISLWAIYCTF